MSASQPAVLEPPSPVLVLGRRAGAGRRSERGALAGRLTLRGLALGYLALLLVAPVGMVFYRTFQSGLEPVWQTLSDPKTLHAFQVTLIAAWFNYINRVADALGVGRDWATNAAQK